MVYTNTELRNAFLEMRGYNADKDGTPQEFIAKIEAEIQAKIDERLARLPRTARTAMKARAVAYLAEKDKEQELIDNQGGEL